ncbi:MAG: HEAT repeat domain-containing protein [Planctomycetota bacterium]
MPARAASPAAIAALTIAFLSRSAFPQAPASQGSESPGPPTTQAAPTSAPSLDRVLEAARTYTFGQSRVPLAAVERAVHEAGNTEARGAIAAALAASLAAPGATAEYKAFVCRQLSVVCRPAEVPALATLLGDPDLSLAAREALERLPGDEAAAALRAALDRLEGAPLVGVITSVAARRDTAAVPALIPRLSSADPAVATAAAAALGEIGDPRGVEALRAAAPTAGVSVRPVVREALLRAADRLRVAGQPAAAEAIYREFLQTRAPDHVQEAAFRGLLACPSAGPDKLALTALHSPDAVQQVVAVDYMRRSGNRALAAPLCQALPRLAAPARMAALATLAEWGDRSTVPNIILCVASQERCVRIAAYAALVQLGDGKSVSLLARLAARASGEELAALRSSLVRLRGQDVEPALLDLLRWGMPAVRREAVIALRDRQARAAVPALVTATGDADARVRSAALEAVATLGDVQTIPPLIEALKRCADPQQRAEAEAALASIAERAPTADEGLAPVWAAWAAADEPLRISLLAAAGRVGGATALQNVRAALKDESEAVRKATLRTLADWRDTAALPDLLELARTSSDARTRICALRGIATVAGRAAGGTVEELVGALRNALALAERPEERAALCAALGRVHVPAALQVAQDQLATKAGVDEAALAAVQIARAIPATPAAPEVRAVLEHVLATCEHSYVREQAALLLRDIESAGVVVPVGATAPLPATTPAPATAAPAHAAPPAPPAPAQGMAAPSTQSGGSP